MTNYWELTKSLPNNLNQDVINDFLLSLKLSNRSEGTVIQYRRFLEKFFSNMDDPFDSISSDTIHQWFLKHEANVKEVTFRYRLSILASFFTFCVREDYLNQSPIKSRWFPRLLQSIPRYLEKEDIAITRQQSEQEVIRNQVLIEFMLTSGCRVGEVHALNREDVDLENRTARVIGKGKKIRHVHFTERCAVLMERYIDSAPHSPALFVTSTGKRLSIRVMQSIVSNIGKEAALTTRLYPHRLRHSFATQLLAKGADLSFICDELGHSQLGTTQIYARLPKKELIALYRKYMG